MQKTRSVKREIRHRRIRKKLAGTSANPRLCVYRSLKNLQAQIVDDISGHILFGMSTLSKELREKNKYGGNVGAAAAFGELFAVKAQAKGFKKVRFDRGGYLFHGRVKAFAEAARKSGMEF